MCDQFHKHSFNRKTKKTKILNQMIGVTYQDRICFLEMQDAKHFNCLSEELCGELSKALDEAYEHECVGIVIKAQCSKGVWSAGHNIHELPVDGSDPLAFDVPMERLLRRVQDVAIPVIAYVDGTVWGGACDLCLSCDMIVAADTTTFAITPAKLGIPYNASGILHFINQLGINKAREMFFTANAITAEEALNVGLINHVAPIDELPALLEEKILAPLRRNSILSISAIKRQFRILSRVSATISSESFERINYWRQRVYNGPDYKEGIRSFFEKRAPQYVGKASDLDIQKNK